MKSQFFILSFSIITVFMWGLWGFFGKLAFNRKMIPLTMFLTEIVVSLLIALAFLVYMTGYQKLSVWNTPWNLFGLLSGLGLALGLVFYYYALQSGMAAVVVPLTSLYPAVTVGLSYLLLDERPTPAQWLGLVMVVGGGYLLVSGNGQEG